MLILRTTLCHQWFLQKSWPTSIIRTTTLCHQGFLHKSSPKSILQTTLRPRWFQFSPKSILQTKARPFIKMDQQCSMSSKCSLFSKCAGLLRFAKPASIHFLFYFSFSFLFLFFIFIFFSSKLFYTCFLSSYFFPPSKSAVENNSEKYL